jgi:hypothetical protein
VLIPRRLVEFGQLVRDNGCPVGIQEMLDAQRVVRGCGVTNPQGLSWGLGPAQPAMYRAGRLGTLRRAVRDALSVLAGLVTTLWIMGHGRIAECLCPMGDLLGLDVVVNDPGVARAQYPNATQLIADDLEYDRLQLAPDDFAVVATQHKGEHQSRKRSLASRAGYIALTASRKRSIGYSHFGASRYPAHLLRAGHSP